MLSLFALLALFFPAEAPANILIGNGGCGRVTNGRVVLEDFYAYGVNNPYLGDAEGPIDLSRLRLDDFFSEFGIGKELLQAKFNQLERISPGLGKSTLAVLLSYEWKAVSAPLYLNLQCTQKNQVQVANRYRGRITMDKNILLKMAVPDRLGLIFHEIIYSLIKPTCDDAICRQDAGKAKLITALLFDDTHHRGFVLKALLRANLTLPVLPDCRRNDLSLIIKISNYLSGEVLFARSEKFLNVISREDELYSVNKFMRRACDALPAGPRESTRFMIRAQVPVMQVKPTKLRSEEDDLPFAFSEGVESRLSYATDTQGRDCYDTLTGLYAVWRLPTSRRSVRFLDYCPAVNED